MSITRTNHIEATVINEYRNRRIILWRYVQQEERMNPSIIKKN